MSDEIAKALRLARQMAENEFAQRGDNDASYSPTAQSVWEAVNRALTACEKAGASPSPAGGMLGELERLRNVDAERRQQLIVRERKIECQRTELHRLQTERDALSSENATLRGAIAMELDGAPETDPGDYFDSYGYVSDNIGDCVAVAIRHQDFERAKRLRLALSMCAALKDSPNVKG